MKKIITIILLISASILITSAQELNQRQTFLDQTLKQFVKDGHVDYQGIKAAPIQLKKYLLLAGSVSEYDFQALNEKEQLAFLINLYNASIIQLIIDHYPIESIKKIGNAAKGPWSQPVVKLHGKLITLNQLEHGIIRKRYKDPRVHMALVCAAKSCPPLRNEVYTAEKLDAQLDDQAKRFLASPAGLIITKNKAQISAIFKWYKKDFESIPDFIDKYSRQPIKGKKLSHLKYDWSLNE
jgi:hypothetical protein